MLIELRIRPGDYRFRSVLRSVETDHLVNRGKVHKVPHLSIYGNANVPFGRLPELRKRVAKVCSKYHTLPYLVDNYDSKVTEEGKVIAFRIIPSPELLSFRKELVKSLRKDFRSEKPWDDSEHADPWFHITVAHKLPDNEFDRVWAYLNESDHRKERRLERPIHVRKVRPYLPLEGLRVTILDNRGLIDREYDLARRRFLTRSEALDWREWCRTYRAFRVKTRIELKRSGWLGRFTRRSKKPEWYFISDLHLDHGNIIRYTARPFCRDVRQDRGRDTDEMNRVLVNNWNLTVRNNDRVYFLGDLCEPVFQHVPPRPGRRPASYWWPKLNGEKFFVKGNHDDKSVDSIQSDRLRVWDEEVKGTKHFAIVHDPNEMPDGLRKWVGENRAWLIHGDKHNNSLRDYPFINGEKRRINVSVEVIDYKPLSLTFLLSLGLNTIRRMDTIQSVPLRCQPRETGSGSMHPT